MESTVVDSPTEEQIVEELERGLSGIFGVRGARVMLDAAGDIREVHVVTSPKRSPKKIVRDIETYLAVRYRRRVDYRCISCMQLSDDVALQDRQTLHQIGRSDGYVDVVLNDGTHQLPGRMLVDDEPLSAGAGATVTALNRLWETQPRLRLIQAQSVEIGQRPLAVVYLTYTGRGSEHLTGTSFIRGSREEAAARAVLSAVNRRLRAWLSEQKS